MNILNEKFKCTKSKCFVIILLGWLSYVLSYLGRVNYGACILEIVNQTGIARGTAGLVSVISMIMLLTLGRFSVICAIAMFTLNSMLMTASLTLYQSLYPIRMFRGFNTAFIVGILNFCFHGGGFIGAVSEAFGWNCVFGLLLAVALISAANLAIGGMRNVKNSI